MRKYAFWIFLVVVLIIIGIIVWYNKRKKTTNQTNTNTNNTSVGCTDTIGIKVSQKDKFGLLPNPDPVTKKTLPFLTKLTQKAYRMNCKYYVEGYDFNGSITSTTEITESQYNQFV